DAEAHRTYSYFLAAMGRADQAITEIQRAQQIDPLNIWTQITAGWVYYYSRQYDKAIAQCQNLLKLDPNAAGAYDCLGTSYLAEGQYQKAIEAAQKASGFSNGDPTRVVGLGRAYALAGRKADARKVIEQLRQLSAHTYVSPYFFATIYAALGQKDEAFRWLEKAFRQHDQRLAWLKVDGAIDTLRHDVRLQALLQRLRLTN
ncbi:MAG: tetratricopeptide repeat protein, partial [Candidatus Acidiferrales bacterium]